LIIERSRTLPIDEALLEAHRSFRDEGLGIREQFVRLQAGPAGTIGVLSLPLSEQKRLGWVICHSFGSEQVDLYMTDVAVARGLAAAGYPTLRFHCHGYGDSEDYSLPARPSTQLRDTLDVVEQFPALAGVDQIGLFGVRFGGAVAAQVAQRVGASHLVLVHPIVNGAKYATEVLRSRVIMEILDEHPGEGASMEALKAELDTLGMVNVKGWALYSDVVDELREADLMKQLESLSARTLVFQVSRSPAITGGLTRLVDKLRELGAHAQLDVLTHPAAPNLGYEHFRPVGRDVLGDILEGVNQQISDRTVRWLKAEEPLEAGAR
jgi:pimeloyl-ACP methyl ester carboxylesterase